GPGDRRSPGDRPRRDPGKEARCRHVARTMGLTPAVAYGLLRTAPQLWGGRTDRSQRYALLEAGHISENANLAATSMGLGVCGIGATKEGGWAAWSGMDGEHGAPVFLVAVGPPPA